MPALRLLHVQSPHQSWQVLCSGDILAQQEDNPYLQPFLPLPVPGILWLLLFRSSDQRSSEKGLYTDGLFFRCSFQFRSVYNIPHFRLFSSRSGKVWNVLCNHPDHRSHDSPHLPEVWTIQYCFPHQNVPSAPPERTLLFHFLPLRSELPQPYSVSLHGKESS